MILLNCRTIPWSTNVILELVRVDEDQWAQEGDKHNQKHIKYSKKSMHLENAIAKDES